MRLQPKSRTFAPKQECRYMFVTSFILQIGTTEASEAIAAIIDGTEAWKQSVVVIVVVIVANIVLALIQWFIALGIKNKDVAINRQNKITDMGITIEAKIYQRMGELNNYVKGEDVQMQQKITEFTTFKNENSLYVRKELKQIADYMADYYAILLQDWRRKDMKMEDKKMKEYRNKFYA